MEGNNCEPKPIGGCSQSSSKEQSEGGLTVVDCKSSYLGLERVIIETS